MNIKVGEALLSYCLSLFQKQESNRTKAQAFCELLGFQS